MISNTLNFTNIKEFNTEKYLELSFELSKIDPTNLDSELVNFTVVYSFYHGILVSAKKLVDNAKLERDTFTATYKTDKRKTRKYAVADLEDLATSQPEIELLSKKVSSAEEIYSLVKALCNTLEHKKDMLIQLSANSRQEAKIYS